MATVKSDARRLAALTKFVKAGDPDLPTFSVRAGFPAGRPVAVIVGSRPLVYAANRYMVAGFEPFDLLGLPGWQAAMREVSGETRVYELGLVGDLGTPLDAPRIGEFMPRPESLELSGDEAKAAARRFELCAAGLGVASLYGRRKLAGWVTIRFDGGRVKVCPPPGDGEGLEFTAELEGDATALSLGAMRAELCSAFVGPGGVLSASGLGADWETTDARRRLGMFQSADRREFAGVMQLVEPRKGL